MMKKDKTIPKFKNEDEERKLKPSLKSISIRLPEGMLAELKTLANKKDVPYQSLAKIYLARQISLERRPFRAAPKKRRRKADAQKPFNG